MKTVQCCVLFAIGFYLFSCQDSANLTNSNQEKSTSSVKLIFLKTAEVANDVESAICIVSGSDMDTIFKDLVVTDDSIYGTIVEIPAGINRYFEVSVYNAAGTLTYQGHTISNVPAGEIIILNITLYPVDSTGTVIIVGTFSSYPEREKIVFQSGDTDMYDIYLMDVNNRGIQNLTNTPNTNEQRPRISPDRSKILFTRKVDDVNRPFIMNLDGLDIHELTIFEGKSVILHDWSPDGNEIVFTYDNNLYIYNVINENITQITEDGIGYNDPRWSPTGNWIGYFSGEYATYKIYLIKPDGSEKHMVPNIEHLECRRFAFSPDGQTLAICARASMGYTWDIFTINIDGSNLLMITDTPSVDESKLTYSPDGNKILFARFDGGDPNDLYIMNNDGSQYEVYLELPKEQNYPHWR